MLFINYNLHIGFLNLSIVTKKLLNMSHDKNSPKHTIKI